MAQANILLVEDDLKLQALVERYLVNEHYQVFKAQDAKEAETLFFEHPIDCVLLDVMLKTTDGWRVLRTLRQHSQVPIIMLTARSEEDDKLFGFEMGADDYLTKPFSLKELMARIKVQLNKHLKHHDVLNIGVLNVDLKAEKATLEGRPLALSPTEYALLVLFMQEVGHVLSRALLLDRVWGYDYYGDTRTVDTHVKRLRQKLKPYPFITTVRGSGYRFDRIDDAT